MKLTDNDIDFIIKADEILKKPNHFPDGEKTINLYKVVFEEEIKNKNQKYNKTLKPTCASCIKFCVKMLMEKIKELDVLSDDKQ